MTASQTFWLSAIVGGVGTARVAQRFSDWCAANLVFNEPGCTGPFSFAGREYLREALDDWGDDSVTDETLVWGTRLGKTRVLYGGVAGTIARFPCRILYVKPKTKGTAGAEDDAKTRFIPMLRSSPALSALIPDGRRRHDFKTLQQIIGGSIVDWTGSNSVAALASNPARVVVQDEVDKFNATRRRDETGQVVEADASALADERCKEFSNPKRFKASTPTLAGGRIWQELLKSDLSRRFVPCPHCQKFSTWDWSERISLSVKKFADGTDIPIAYVAWDQEARREHGWDLDRVERSARIVCPHCQGHILDEHKADCDRAGEWRPTQTGAPGHRGRQLPGMYAQHRQADLGKMAVRFLKAKQSGDLRGFINSDLALPYQGQDRRITQIVINSGLKKNREGIADRTTRIGAGDRQKGLRDKHELPHWWHVIADVKVPENPGDKLRVQIVSEGKCLTDANLIQTFRDHEVYSDLVILDSGWDADHVYALAMAEGFYVLKMDDSEKRYAGHEDKGWKIWSPKKPLHTVLGNFPSKFPYKLKNGIHVPAPLEPMFMHAAKYPLMEHFLWMRSSPLVSYEVPEDVSEDFKLHMAAWTVEERRKQDGQTVKKWLQLAPRDDLFQCCCYIDLMMLDGGLIGEFGD